MTWLLAQLTLTVCVWTASAQILQCVSDPPGIVNGIVISIGPYFENSRASYDCQAGYVMSGIANDVICLNTEWHGTAPICDAETTIVGSIEYYRVYVIAAFGVLIGLLFVIIITLCCFYCCCRHRNGKIYHLRPLSDGGYKRHVYHNEHIYQKEPKITTSTIATQFNNNKVDTGTGNGYIYTVKSAGTQMYHKNINIATNTSPAHSPSPIPALSIISLEDIQQTTSSSFKAPKPRPPPAAKPPASKPPWMPHKHPVRNINTSTK